MEAVDGVGEEDGEAVEVVEEAVDAARGDVVASGLTVLLLELADVLARRESGEMDKYQLQMTLKIQKNLEGCT